MLQLLDDVANSLEEILTLKFFQDISRLRFGHFFKLAFFIQTLSTMFGQDLKFESKIS